MIDGVQTDENSTEDGLNNGRKNSSQFPIKLEFKNNVKVFTCAAAH